MGVTVNANGLSVVHQGSGGEANATLPDVCLTQCGPPVVPIPYGNNAKSADLADGTTTITMDGGNSVAIKGSKFSKSTGDAGGDKKGVASGTIEAEAEFISASPTVKFEGAGVCRLSDQMTMNKANTMCLGGAQNPSVSVSEDAEGTYTIDVQCCYPDGEPLTNANFKVLDSAGAEIASGQLDNKGKGSVGGLPAVMCVIEYEEDARPFSVIPMRDTNPHKKDLSDDEFFEYCAKDCLPFWKSRTIDASRQSWGVFESNLSTDKQFKQMLAYEYHTHFQYQASDYEVHLLATSLTTLFDDNNVDNGHIENYISVLASIVAPDGEVITLTQKIHKDESKHNFLALMRARGYGDAQTYLQDFDWDAQKKLLVNETSDVLQKVQTRLQTMKQYADREGYEAISVQLGEHAEKVKNTKQGLSDSFSQAIASLKEKSQTIQQNGSVPKVVNQFQNGGSTESGKVNDIVYVQKVMPKPLPISLTYDDKEKTPVSNIPYQAKYSNGEVFKGWLDGEGKALIYGVPQQEVPKIEFGDSDKAAQAESNRPAQLKVLKDELQKYSDHLVKETVSYNATQLNLQKELLEQLKTQTEEELNELRDKKAALDNASLTEYCWELAKSAAEGVGDGVVNYIPDFGEISDYLDALDIDLSVLIYALTTGDIDVLEEALKK
ncbi:PAAR-like domain-containing protein [Vibrio olivae]